MKGSKSIQFNLMVDLVGSCIRRILIDLSVLLLDWEIAGTREQGEGAGKDGAKVNSVEKARARKKKKRGRRTSANAEFHAINEIQSEKTYLFVHVLEVGLYCHSE